MVVVQRAPSRPTIEAAGEKMRPKRIRKRRTLWQKLKWRVVVVFRAVFFLLIYMSWPLFRRWLKPDFVFQVYGTDSDKRAYWPKWAERFFRPVFPVGLIRYGRLWGLIGATLITAEDCEGDPQLSVRLMEQTLAEFPHAKAVALAGRLPGFIRRAGADIKPPFVDGSAGTRFAMLSAARELARHLGRHPREICLGLPGGAGYIGTKLVNDLSREFARVVALDPRYDVWHDTGKVLYTRRAADISEAQAVIVLTAKGDDVVYMASHFRPGAIVGDDTHPPIHRHLRDQIKENGVDLWKITVSDGKLSMRPRLPNFRSDDIPGCLLEALVVLLTGSQAATSQEAFNDAAEECGFSACLNRHTDDS